MTGLADPSHDPRPRVEATDASVQVIGVRCPAWGWGSAVQDVACSACGGDTEPARFGPTGTVWSWTVVRIPVADLEAPYALAFVDLDDGPPGAGPPAAA